MVLLAGSPEGTAQSKSSKRYPKYGNLATQHPYDVVVANCFVTIFPVLRNTVALQGLCVVLHLAGVTLFIVDHCTSAEGAGLP